MRPCWLSILVALSACRTSPPASPDGALDATPDATASPDAAGTCRVVADLGAAVMEMNVATEVPAPLGGGPIPDGTYTLTATTHYTGAGGASGPTGVTVSQTSYLAAGLSHVVTTMNGSSTYDDYALAPEGTAIVITRTCPTWSALSYDGYTSQDGVVTFYDSTGRSSLEFTLVQAAR